MPAGLRRPVELVVGLAGGSGSGKSSLAAAIAKRLGPEHVGHLSYDAYYRDRGDLAPEARAALDYDVPDAFDRAHFLRDLRALRAGRAVTPPRYCFATHRRLGAGPTLVPRPVLLVDGILLLHEPAIVEVLDLKIFVDAPLAVRRARRLARDTAERGRAPDAALRQFDSTVSAAHAAHVEPSKAAADLVLLNVGRLGAAAEVAATIIRDRLARRRASLPGRTAVAEGGP